MRTKISTRTIPFQRSLPRIQASTSEPKPSQLVAESLSAHGVYLTVSVELQKQENE